MPIETFQRGPYVTISLPSKARPRRRIAAVEVVFRSGEIKTGRVVQIEPEVYFQVIKDGPSKETLVVEVAGRNYLTFREDLIFENNETLER